MQILLDELEGMATESKCKDSVSLSLLGVRQFEVGMQASKNIVYICGEELFETALLDKKITSVILIGKTPDNFSEIPENIDVIVVSPNNSIAEIYIKVQSAIEKLNFWHESMANAILCGEPIQRLMDTGASILRNPVGLCDNATACIAWSGKFPEDYRDIVWTSVFKTHYAYVYPGDFYKSIQGCDLINIERVKLYDARSTSFGKQLVWAEIIPHNEGHEVVGLIFSTQVGGEITIGQASILNKLVWFLGNSPLLVSALQFDKAQINQVLRNTINGEFVNKEMITLSAAMYFPNNIESFRVLVVDFDDMFGIKNAGFFSVGVLERKLKSRSEAVFPHNDCMVFVSAELKTKQDVQERYDLLKTIYNPSVFRFGVSEEFSSIEDVREYYMQAVASIELGMVKNSRQKVFYFRDCALGYILKNVREEVSLTTHCHPMAKTLHDFDEANDTDYLKTMACLFSNKGNYAKTALELYMHRNTLSYRLDRIKQIVNVDEFDYAEQPYFLTSCQILEWGDLNKIQAKEKDCKPDEKTQAKKKDSKLEDNTKGNSNKLNRVTVL